MVIIVTRVILVTHKGLARGLMESAKLLVGDKADLVEQVELLEHQSLEDLISVLSEKVKKYSGEDILILVDLLGGTPSRAALALAQMHSDIHIVTGVNLPMLLDIILNMGEARARELASIAERSGREGIVNLEEKIARMKNI